MVFDIRWLACNGNWTFSWIRRSKNRAAHWVAGAQESKTLSASWVACPPLHLVELLSSNVNVYVP
ncbi:hypothetical protein ACSBR1_039164 [Camellia fascicularis]